MFAAARLRARRLGDQACGDDRLPFGRRRSRRNATSRRSSGVGIAACRPGRRDAVSGHERGSSTTASRPARSTTGCRASPTACRMPLIDVAIERFGSIPSTDVGDPVRALPRRGDADPARPRPRFPTASRAGTWSCRRSGSTRPRRRRTSPGRATRTRPFASTCPTAAGSTTSATTRAPTPCAARMARTGTGWSRSSAGSTRTTCSTTTTTSRRADLPLGHPPRQLLDDPPRIERVVAHQRVGFDAPARRSCRRSACRATG